MNVRRGFADPKVRLVAGLVGMCITTLPLHRDRVGSIERRVFRVVNHLPDSWFGPAWSVMQLGTVGAAPAAAVVAHATGRRRLAADSSSGVWARGPRRRS